MSRIVVVLPMVSLIPAVISMRPWMGEKNAVIEPDRRVLAAKSSSSIDSSNSRPDPL